MNQPPRGTSSRSSNSYVRHIQPNQHNSRNSHSTRWPTVVTHVPFSKDYRPLFSSNEKEGPFDGYAKQSLTNTTVSGAQNLFANDSTNERRELRQLTPPMPFNVCSAQGQENPLSVRGSPLQTLSSHTSILTAAANTLEINPRSNLPLRQDLCVSPIHLQNNSTYFCPVQPDERPKSESPPCKRRRVSARHVENTSRWEPRRSRSHTQHRRSSSVRKLRYNNYQSSMWDRNETYQLSPPHHSVPYRALHSSPPPSPLQPALMVDVTQVPITVPVSVSIYAGPPITVCQGSAYSTPQVHNVYANQAPRQVASQYASFMPTHRQYHVAPNIINSHHQSHHHQSHYHHSHHHYSHHHHQSHHHHMPHNSTFIGTPSPPAVHCSTPPRSTETVLHVSPPPSIFISDNRSSPLEINTRSRLAHPAPRRWRYHAFSSGPQYQNVLQFLAMLATPLSPELGSSESEMENYEALLHVAARLSEERPRGLNRCEINQIPSFKFETVKHNGDQTSCVVCMCDFENQQTLRDLPCSHKFHAKCVDKWLKTSRTCPICRGNATGDPTLSE